MRHLTAADFLRTPWKNGGGETVQIAIFPDGAGLDDFTWRISTAGIDHNGLFSLFAGIDRSLVVLSGAGVVLDIDGARHELTANSPPLGFSGSSTTFAELVAGPVTDFNVMSRSGLAAHTVSRMAKGETASTRSGFAFVFAVSSARLTGIDLAPGDLLVLAPGEAVTLETGSALQGSVISQTNGT